MKLRGFLAAALAMFLLAGCAENPDSDIVIHKDMDKVISEAQQTGENKAELNELREETHYNADFEQQSLRVRVHADADIITPAAEHLSVIHVEKAQFSQAFVDQVRAELIGDQPIFDGKVQNMRAKADILTEIGQVRAAQNELPPDDTVMYADYQDTIDKLQAEYEAAPEELVCSEYPSDGLLHPIKALYEQEKASHGGKDIRNAYYASRYAMNPDGEMMCCVTDGANGMYSFLYFQNSPDSGSFVRFTRTPLELLNIGQSGLDFVVCKPSRLCGLPENTLAIYGGDRQDYQPLPGNTAELSQADAQEQAERLLSAFGLHAFSLYEGGLYSEVGYSERTQHYHYRTCYILRYYRNIDGVPLLRGGGKASEQDESFRRKYWESEMIEIRVDDNGIIGFYYISPLQMMETTVSDAALKQFSEIRETFEKMIPMMTAPDQAALSVEANVERIILCYIRISEKNSFDTGYVVPVWGFYGSRSLINDRGERMEGISGSSLLMSINAIDGSVIVPGAGY